MAEEVSTPRRFSGHPTHCPGCSRPWEYHAQVSHKCEYCHHRLNWKETSTLKKILWLFWDFFPVILFVAFGFAVCAILGVNYHG